MEEERREREKKSKEEALKKIKLMRMKRELQTEINHL
jgi:hypothetical protein